MPHWLPASRTARCVPSSGRNCHWPKRHAPTSGFWSLAPTERSSWFLEIRGPTGNSGTETEFLVLQKFGLRPPIFRHEKSMRKNFIKIGLIQTKVGESVEENLE